MSSAAKRDQVRLAPGHSLYFAADGALVVEWYDFGENVPYESATTLTIAPASLDDLAKLLHLAVRGRPGILAALSRQVGDYWAARALLDEWKIPYRHHVDFLP